MDIIEKLRQIERLDCLIRSKSTGSPKELSIKIGLSERQTYNIINTMKDMGAPIYFCYYNNSYCYIDNVIFTFGFIKENSSLSRIVGGKGVTDHFYIWRRTSDSYTYQTA